MNEGSEANNLWYVKLANGNIHRVTLDQLDGAFQAGHIDGSTEVIAPDSATGGWSRLGALLGLDEPPTPAPVTITAVPPAVANSLRPMSFDLSAPDLGSDFDDVPFRKGSGRRWTFAFVAMAAAAGAIGFASTRSQSSGGDITSIAAAAAMVAPPAAAPAPLPVVQPAQSPTPPLSGALQPSTQASNAAQAAEASPLNPQFTSRANETKAQKALAAARLREDRAQARHAAGRHHAKYQSTMFTTGGNKYDPLNSNL